MRLIPRDFANVPAADTAADPRAFADVVGTAFGQRRKMLRNNLRSVVSEAELAYLGIAPTARAEDLAVADFVHLANHVVARDRR